MEPWQEITLSIILSALASSGLWTFISKFMDGKDAKAKVLIGLGHDRIVTLGGYYLERGYITRDEYENLNDYLYKPYKELGGNGTAEKIMCDVNKLPIKNHESVKKEN